MFFHKHCIYISKNKEEQEQMFSLSCRHAHTNTNTHTQMSSQGQRTNKHYFSSGATDVLLSFPYYASVGCLRLDASRERERGVSRKEREDGERERERERGGSRKERE